MLFRGIARRAIGAFCDQHAEPCPGATLIMDIDRRNVLVTELVTAEKLSEARRWHVRIMAPSSEPHVSEWIIRTDGKLKRVPRAD